MNDNLSTPEIYTQKIEFKKYFRILWVILLAVYLICTLVFVPQWSKYKNGQKEAYEIMTATSSRYKEGYPYTKATIRSMYDFLNPHPTTVKVNGYYISNSEVVDSAREVDKALGSLLTKKGYSCTYGSTYFMHTNYMDYAAETHTALFAIGVIILPLIIIIRIALYFLGRSGLYTDGEVVTCYNGKKIKKQMMMADINGVTLTNLKGICVSGTGGKWNCRFVANREEIKEFFMEKMLQKQQNIASSAEPSPDTSQTTAAPDDYTAELLRIKSLLDQGVITQEEFDAKKKQILGL